MMRFARTTALLMALSVLIARFASAESIPLKPEGGTYVVPVLINGKITLDFTLDSGAAEVSIPADVFGTLRRTETISRADLLEPGDYVLADGSTRRQPRFRIRTLKVGNLELRNVVAFVAPMQGSLLLGQSFLSRVRTWSVDNQRHVLLLDEGLSSAPVNEPAAREAEVNPDRYATASQVTGVSPERYAAAEARCRAKAFDESICNQLTAEDVLRSEAVAAGMNPDLRAQAEAAGISLERYTAAQARCRANMGGPLCDHLTARDVLLSEAAAGRTQ